jgi:hypothetical protein
MTEITAEIGEIRQLNQPKFVPHLSSLSSPRKIQAGTISSNDAVEFGRKLRTLRRNLLPPSSWEKSNDLSEYMVSYPKRQYLQSPPKELEI